METKGKHPRKLFSQEEDAELIKFVKLYQDTKINWKDISSKMKNRTIRQCKERWEKYLNPNLSVDPWTPEEDDVIINMFYEFGPKWTLISNMLENRTDIMVRNRWNVINRKALKVHKKKNKEKEKKNNKKAKNQRKKKEPKQNQIVNKPNPHVKNEKSDNTSSILNQLNNSCNQFDMSEIDQFIEMNNVIDFDMFF